MSTPYLIAVAAAVAVLVVALALLVGAIYRRRSDRGAIDMSLDTAVRQLLDDFLVEFGRRARWDQGSIDRLRAAGEEVLTTLAARDGADAAGFRRMRVSARMERGAAVLEFLAAPQGTNLEEQIAVLEDHADVVEESQLSLRLLEHYASSVRHRHYHLNDLLTVRVERGGSG